MVKADTGKAAASYEYDAFGNTLKATGEYAQRNPFQFSTKYTDKETNLVYFGYRYYLPQLGRWLGRDPSHEEGGLHLYAYVQNNPISFTDPFGLWATDAHNEILDQAFKNCLSAAQLQKLNDASAYVAPKSVC
jgi:RHS repeat-associated core domain